MFLIFIEIFYSILFLIYFFYVYRSLLLIKNVDLLNIFADDSSDSSWNPTEPASTSTSLAATNAMCATNECGLSTDSSSVSTVDEESEKCPICLHSFREQEVGKPNVCDHMYCAPCIEEWSKQVQTCPIDRKEFTRIIVKRGFGDSEIVREMQVVAQHTELNVDDLTYCEVCNQCDREDSLLLCDGCNRGFHMDCLAPALLEIPSGSWYCDNCFASDASSVADDAENLNHLIAELEMEIGVPETRLRVRRIEETPRITRTRQSERIRAAIMSRIAPSHRHAPTGITESALGMSLPGFSVSLKTKIF